MYRIQLTGNDYDLDREIGLHYQIHRSIGVHHAKAIARGQPFRVNIFVGGPPALTVAAVMPLPEGIAGTRIRRGLRRPTHPPGRRRLGTTADRRRRADFCIVRHRDPRTRCSPEGPFGDHLGYYSLAHPFPVLRRREGLLPEGR